MTIISMLCCTGTGNHRSNGRDRTGIEEGAAQGKELAAGRAEGCRDAGTHIVPVAEKV